LAATLASFAVLGVVTYSVLKSDQNDFDAQPSSGPNTDGVYEDRINKGWSSHEAMMGKSSAQAAVARKYGTENTVVSDEYEAQGRMAVEQARMQETLDKIAKNTADTADGLDGLKGGPGGNKPGSLSYELMGQDDFFTTARRGL
jgi:hypothetical protein